MSHFEVDITGLRKADAAAMSASEQARRIKLGDAANEVPAGILGSESAATAPRLAKAWDERLTSWSADVGAFSTNLASSADRYAADEVAAERDFSLLGGLFGIGPRSFQDRLGWSVEVILR